MRSIGLKIYGKIALTGEPMRFVNEAKALNRWYDVYAFKIGDPEGRKLLFYLTILLT